jgi:hypothetical protein
MRLVVLATLLILGGAPSARAQSIDPAQLVLPIEDLGPGWVVQRQDVPMGEVAGGQQFTMLYKADPNGAFVLSLQTFPDEVTAQVILEQRREGLRDTPDFSVGCGTWPELGDDRAAHCFLPEFSIAVFYYRIKHLLVYGRLGWGYMDPCWKSALAELTEPQEQARRYRELVEERARQFATLQQNRLRLMLARFELNAGRRGQAEGAGEV